MVQGKDKNIINNRAIVPKSLIHFRAETNQMKIAGQRCLFRVADKDFSSQRQGNFESASNLWRTDLIRNLVASMNQLSVRLSCINKGVPLTVYRQFATPFDGRYR